MSFEVSYLNTYSWAMDAANVRNNVKLVCDNAAEKTANTAQELVNQSNNSTNSALLSEYAQNIAKSNVAQQFVLDNNLKETLKFLNAEAAKMKSLQSKYKFVVKEILNDSDVFSFENEEEHQETDSALENLESFDIHINENMVNIFAA